eukprot:scaffold3243_cov106-Isochrysis_galbana.AAC.9
MGCAGRESGRATRCFLSPPSESLSEKGEERAEVDAVGQPPRRELVGDGVRRRPDAVPYFEPANPPQEEVVVGVKSTRKGAVEVAAGWEEEVSRYLRRAEAWEQEAGVVDDEEQDEDDRCGDRSEALSGIVCGGD